MKKLHQIKSVFAGLLFSCSVVPVVMADDIEIYTTLGASSAITQPNILFIVDASSDMLSTSSVPDPYNPGTGYHGDCSSDFVYFSSDGSLPECTSNNKDYFKKSALVCKDAWKAILYVLGDDGLPLVDEATGELTGETEEVEGPLETSGRYSGRIAQNAPSGNGGSAVLAWRAVSITQAAQREYIVECEADNGIHGVENDSAGTYIENGADQYTSTEPEDIHPIWLDNSSVLSLFNANYINYRNANNVQEGEVPYITQIKNAVKTLVETTRSINIGLMVLDQSANGAGDPGSEGGGIMYEVQDGALPRGNFVPQLLAINAEGSTPLSEAYYEALLYYGGKAVDYGTAANPPLVGSATDAGNVNYTSPIQLSCQKNYIVLATNGKATHDDISAARQTALPGFTSGSCSDSITANIVTDDNIHTVTDGVATSVGLTDDNCLDELAEWAQNNDVATLPIATHPAHEGDQVITTHAIGFGYDDDAELSDEQLAGQQLLKDTAKKGDGDFYTANSQDDLEAVFKAIVSNALKVNSTFSSPAVSVNAFNRSTHLDDLYFTLFKPTDGNHWEGNLKKYKLKFAIDTGDKDGDGDITERLPFIADKNGAEAIAADTGFFSDNALSYWSEVVDGEPDGKEVSEGGAVSRLTTTRNVYTFTGSYVDGGIAPAAGSGVLSTIDANAVDPTNDALTEALLDVAGYDEIVSGTSYRETLINWASGLDALSNFGSVADSYDDVRPQMGDPLHAEPALVQYGDVLYESETVADLVAYTATNDGYLHAINVNSGSEIFSFIPQELLPNLQIAMEDKGGAKLYGLDGSVVAWINDANGDGIIDKTNSHADDHVYIYVSMRRGGRNIYALDVTNRTTPKLLWVIKGGEGQYTELGQTWSTVNVEKIKDAGVEKTVLIFGGGYDDDQDNATVTTEDDVGRTVYIADATTGARLWTAGQDADIATVTMDYSVPARVKPLDISGDGFIDRLYVADMGGQIFRFDIDNNSDQALASSIIGGLIADLADASTELIADRDPTKARRFYYPPDVALINASDGPYHSLVISSGFRAHPLLNTTIQDRIYMIKDRHTGAITSTDTYITLTEANLHNATTNMAGGEGGNDTTRATELGNITSAEGWLIYLDDEDTAGSWLGEKGLAEALIIEGVAIVTTYTPDPDPDTTTCKPNLGLGKVYFLDILDATAAFPNDLDSRGDRHIELVRGGIPPTPSAIIPKDGVPTLCIGTECSKAELGLGVRKTYWYEVN